jgi:hypothetical protein
MNELTGAPCNRRKHRFESFTFPGVFVFACSSTWLDEAVFVEA